MKPWQLQERLVVGYWKGREIMTDHSEQMNEGDASAVVETIDVPVETSQAMVEEPDRKQTHEKDVVETIDAPVETPQAVVEGRDRQQTHEKDPDATIDVPKATGPRTARGKNRSRRNAVRHGIFTNAIPLEGDALAEFQALLAGLDESLQPVGPTEDLIVEELAILNWRKRQLFIAHQAEVRKSQEFIQWDRKQELEREAEEQALKTTAGIDIMQNFERNFRAGMVWKKGNPIIMDACIEQLKNVVKIVESDERWWDSTDIYFYRKAIYGDNQLAHPDETLNNTYTLWRHRAEALETGRGQRSHATPEQCKAEILKAIAEEIARLERCKSEALQMEARRTELEILRRSVPEGVALEHLMRYEAHLSRIEDRKLTQLERLQRMRRGQPVLPPMKVEVSQN